MIDFLKVSVIIVVKNGERYLSTAIESAIAQTYPIKEIIVIDGQSSDNTRKIARSFSQVRYIWQNNLGLANARNLGIEVAEGELIAFLDYDDLWQSNKLQRQVDYFIKEPALKYTIALVKSFLESGCSLRPEFKKQDFEQIKIGYTPSSLVVKKSLFNEIGFFNPDFAIGCDSEWFSRAKDCQISMKIIPEVLQYKRIHNLNLSANIKNYRAEMLTIIKQSLKRKRELNVNTSQ